MKKPDRKSLLRLSWVVLVILALVGLAWKQAEDKLQTEFSASNTGLTGLSLYTRTLEDLGFETKYSSAPPRDSEDDVLWTLTLSRTNAASELAFASILEQVGDGGRILLLYPGDSCEYADFSESGYIRDHDVSFTSVDQVDYTLTEWHDTTGSVILTASLDPLVNLFIADDPAYAYLLLQQIHPLMGGTGIRHNDYYLYWQPIGTSLWLDMPLWLKMIVCQLLVVLIAFILYRGKRFGKAKKYLEEEEPEEDQVPKAVGELYHQGGHWELVLESHWHRFLEELNKRVPTGRKANAGNWLEIWDGAGFSENSEALRTDTLLRKLAGESSATPAETPGMRKKRAHRRKEAVLLLRELEENMGKRGTTQWNTKKSNLSANEWNTKKSNQSSND